MTPRLLARGVVAGKTNYDVDDALEDNPDDQPPIGPLTPIDTGAGLASIRFADVDGHHEWIAATNQSAPLDKAIFSQSRIAIFHWSGGTLLSDDTCIADLAAQCLDDPTRLAP